MTIHKIAPGCTFESEEDVVMNPVKGRKKSVVIEIPKPYYRTSELDNIPDNFVERMKKFKRVETRTEEREVKTPDGFAVSIAYNKSGYQLIPKDDL
tara:strand:+ start:760 stop:1047 length:288 start_codon:yes stop_codon:yes gene_type:complete